MSSLTPTLLHLFTMSLNSDSFPDRVHNLQLMGWYLSHHGLHGVVMTRFSFGGEICELNIIQQHHRPLFQQLSGRLKILFYIVHGKQATQEVQHTVQSLSQFKALGFLKESFKKIVWKSPVCTKPSLSLLFPSQVHGFS